MLQRLLQLRSFQNARHHLATSASGPLAGIKVLDLTRVLAGPFASQILGDYGADVVKIETPQGGDDTRSWGPPFVGGESAYFLGLNRNKRSVALNLKSPAGVDVLRRMASVSDIMIENFVPGKAAELGIGYEALSAVNPRLIYCSLSGYGATGPDSDRLGYDVVISAEGGLMGITGEPSGAPVKCGVALTDVSTGLFLHGAILAALYSRTTTGRGQLLQTSLLETQASILVNAASAYLNGGVEGKRSGTAHPSIVPYQTFATADGHIMIAAGNDAQFRRLCERMRDAVQDDSLLALITDVKFATNKARVQHRNELIPRLSTLFLRLKTSDWMVALGGGREFPCAPINSLRAVFDQHPQVKHLQVVQEMPHPTAGHVRVVRTPVTFSDTPSDATQRAPPLLGQHTDQVLTSADWGVFATAEQLSSWRTNGVIR